MFAAAVAAAVTTAVPTRAQTPPTPPAQASAQTAEPPKPNNYGEPANWLCRPGRSAANKDFCDIDLTTTVVAADGTVSREGFKTNPNAPIDCFYVYPTISTDPSPNSDMN